MASPSLDRAIGLPSATLLVIGGIVGSGIFLTTGIMAAALPSPTLLLLAWLVGGLFALAGALTYAELGAMFPRAGGVYIYLHEAFGALRRVCGRRGGICRLPQSLLSCARGRSPPLRLAPGRRRLEGLGRSTGSRRVARPPGRRQLRRRSVRQRRERRVDDREDPWARPSANRRARCRARAPGLDASGAGRGRLAGGGVRRRDDCGALGERRLLFPDLCGRRSPRPDAQLAARAHFRPAGGHGDLPRRQPRVFRGLADDRTGGDLACR